ncbi:CBS domain-containing protein [Pseudonocardia acaciae]|uniref:CBS domain-containing protein n=1 Tax=Pseudonocardia acaciae TaxID=551276 RepID=UPI00048FD6AA|nr:CBS domain-containing protein [Pseudonocardia acaciae]
MPEPPVAQLMHRRVITAVPDTPFKELAGLMITRDLDALPVIDPAGRPLGVVTEADVLAKLEFHGGTDYPPLLASGRCRSRWRKSAGLTAAELMTTPAATVGVDEPVHVAVRALATHRVRRLCVVSGEGRLVGMIARQDVLRVFLRGDGVIRADVEHELREIVDGSDEVGVEIADGVVTLSGTLSLRSATEHAGRVTHHVPGVIAVHNNLRYDIDDLVITGL